MPFRRKFLIGTIILLLIGFTLVAFILPSKYTVPVLMYHHVRPDAPDDRLSVLPGNFKKQMDFLAKRNYQVISLEELVNLIKSQKPLPRNLVVITFDDGYKDNYLYAFPSLKANNLSATIFLITDHIGQENYLNWSEIKEMVNHQIEIGAHTKSHPWLPGLEDKKELEKEILAPKKIIEAELRRPVKFFCYPIGGVNDLVKQAVIKSGYLGACATHPGPKYAKYDIHTLRRIKISNTNNLLAFWVKVSGYYTLFKK